MIRWLVLGLAVAACGGDRRAPAASDARDAAVTAPPRAAVTVEGCRVAWRPTADAVAIVPTVAPAPVKPKGKRGPTKPRPRVELRKPIVVGSMSIDLVRRYVKKQVAALEDCYREAVGRSPALAGQATAIFTIDGTGRVTTARVEGPDDRLDGCIAAGIRAIPFPKPQAGGGVQVRYPMDLHVESAPPPDETEDEDVTDAGVAAPPASALRDLAWADEGVDPAVERWAAEPLAALVRTADLADCLESATGTLDARLGIAADGAIVDLEVTGLGDVKIEECVRGRLSALHVPPPPLPVAAACELTAHEPRPRRISLGAGQSIIEVGAAAGEPQPSAGTSPIVVRVDPAASAAAVEQVTAKLRRLRSPFLLGVTDGADLVLISDMVPRGAGPSPASPRPRTHLALGDDPRVIAARAMCTDCDHIAEIAPGQADAAALRDLAIALRAAGVERIVLAEPP